MSARRVLFASWHFYLDSSNGASISARELLRALCRNGWDVKTFCGPAVDNSGVSNVAGVLKSHGVSTTRRFLDSGKAPFAIDAFDDQGIRSLIFRPENYSDVPDPLTGEIFIEFFRRSLAKIKPDIVVTYGGYWMAPKMIDLIRDSGAKTVFLLLNFAYKDKRLFDSVDLTLVLSQFAADAYCTRVGIRATALPPLIRIEDVAPEMEDGSADQKHVLFVNPSPNKGVFLFAKIANEMAKIRPDIPFLVVEGCSTSRDLLATGVDFRGTKNVVLMSGTSRPSDFYRHAKLTLVPSVFEETFGRVAAESMLAGVPVVASDRGALPEVVGSAGKILHIPEKYTPAATSIPTFEEVKPWIEEIVRLYDDSEYYALRRRQVLERSKEWDYEVTARKYVSAFENLLRTKF